MNPRGPLGLTLGRGLLDRHSRGGIRFAAAFVWLLFIVFPLANAVGHHGPPLQHGLAIGGAVAFVGAYVMLVLTWRPQQRDRFALALFVVLLVLATPEIHRPAVSLDAAAEAVLAWAVREGATNVIRHSRASRCLMTISASLGGTLLEVVDDGVGAASQAGGGSGGRGAHGLRGLAERAEIIRGRVEADARPEGGFRLIVSVPATSQ